MSVANPFRGGHEHLTAELAWLDAALLILARAMPRVAEGYGQGLFISAEEVEQLLAPGTRDVLVTDGALAGLCALRAQVRERRAASSAAGVVLPLDRLSATFGLEPIEELLVVTCAAGEVDPGYDKVFGYLHDDVSRTHASRELVRRLAALCPDVAAGADVAAGTVGASVLFDRFAPVFRWGIVSGSGGQHELTQDLILDPGVTDLLLERAGGAARGGPGPGATAAGGAVVAALHPEPVEQLTRLLKQHRGTVVRFDGPGASDGEAVLAEVCRWLGAGLERVRLDPTLPPEQVRGSLRGAYRRAALTGAGVFVRGLDDLLADRRARSLVHLLDEVVADGSWCTGVSGGAGWAADGDVIHLPVRLDLPDTPDRTRAWQLVAPGLSPADAAALATGAANTPAEMEAAVRLARLLGAGERPGRADIETARRIRSRAGACTGTTLVEPRAGWDDLVLPDEIAAHLRDFCAQVRHRARVGHEWGLWRRRSLGRGLAALFLGPSGTGKTLAAEVVAGDAGLDLMRIDLSVVVSKYIGETEKNLAKVFDDAARRGAVLFFDEADALFGRRSEVHDAHDRYANIEVGFLLQRIEEFDGVMVLASNRPRDIDDAFWRRMRITVEFPFPDEAARLRIWQAHLPPELPLDDDVDLAVLARECPVAGGTISKILWNAACLAADAGDHLRMAHLRQAVRREYQRLGKPMRTTGAR